MDFVTELLTAFTRACLQLLLHPFYYVGLVFILLHHRRQMMLERKMFSTRLHGMLDETVRTIVAGGVAGLAVSIVMAFLGAVVSPDTVIWIWLLSLLFIVVRVRFLCLAYAAGFVGMLQWLLGWFPALQEGALGGLFHSLDRLHIPSLLALSAVLHLAEAWLMRRNGRRMASPLFVQGKRGKLIGGFHLHGFWPMPLLLLTPAAAADSGAWSWMPIFSGNAAMPWTPLLGGEAWGAGWTIAAFPIVIGFTEMTMSRLPRDKARWTSSRLVIYSTIVLLLAIASAYWTPLTLAASAATLLLHEMLVWYSRNNELRRQPMYVHDQNGLRILAVIPGTPAAELGIRTGELLYRVNGLPIRSKEELHRALRTNSAFCKLEVMDLNGERRFLQRAIFAGDHHQLGLVLAPDDTTDCYVRMKHIPIACYLRSKASGYHSAVRPGSASEREHSVPPQDSDRTGPPTPPQSPIAPPL